MVRGRLELSAGDVAGAMKSQLEALGAAKAIEPLDALRIAQARSHLGDVQTEAGEYDAAIDSFSMVVLLMIPTFFCAPEVLLPTR